MRIQAPNRREEIALFRLGIIGDLLSSDLARGELDPLTQTLFHARFEGREVSVGPCDPRANRHRSRPEIPAEPVPGSIPFHPIAALLAAAAALFAAIQGEIRSLHREHRQHPVLVLDECHLMPDSTIGHLHVLTNFGPFPFPLTTRCRGLVTLLTVVSAHAWSSHAQPPARNQE